MKSHARYFSAWHREGVREERSRPLGNGVQGRLGTIAELAKKSRLHEASSRAWGRNSTDSPDIGQSQGQSHIRARSRQSRLQRIVQPEAKAVVRGVMAAMVFQSQYRLHRACLDEAVMTPDLSRDQRYSGWK